MSMSPASHRTIATVLILALSAAAGCGPHSPAPQDTPEVAPDAPTPPAATLFDEFHQQQVNELLADGYSTRYVFEGTVVAVGLSYEGYVVQVDPIDANWVVVVDRITTLEGDLPKLNDEGTYVFAIHSPTHFFAMAGTETRFFTMEGDGIRDRTSRFRFIYLTRSRDTDSIDRELIAQYIGQQPPPAAAPPAP